jgi:hypothetical protein
MTSRIKVQALCNGDLSVIDRNFAGPRWGVDFSGFALIILGGSLMIQNVLSSWTLAYMLFFRKGTLLTWSLDPIVNAIYMIVSGAKQSAGGGSKTVATVPKSLHKQVFRVRVFIRVVWATLALLVLAVAVAVYFAAGKSSFSPQYLKKHGDNWLFWGRSSILLGLGSRTTDWAGMSLMFLSYQTNPN